MPISSVHACMLFEGMLATSVAVTAMASYTSAVIHPDHLAQFIMAYRLSVTELLPKS